MADVVLVTGAAGFAGSHLIERLSRGGACLVAWDRVHGAPPVETPRTVWETIDLLDGPAVRHAIERVGPSAVYHLAGAAHVGQAWDRTEPALAVNVRGTHHLLEALRLVGRPVRVLIPSSALIYRAAGEPISEDHPLVPSSPYGVSKLAQELLGARASAGGVEVTIARAFNHIGPRQAPSFAASSFARQIALAEAGRGQPEIVVGNLDARRDVTDVRDVVRAYGLILERGQPGRPYNVCSGHAIAISALLDRLVARARLPIRVRVDPARYRPSDTPLVVGRPDRIQQELGWTPEIPLDQTLDDLLEYWRHRAVAAEPSP